MPVVSCILPALIAFSIDVLQVQSTLLLPLFISPRRSGCVGVLEVVQVGAQIRACICFSPHRGWPTCLQGCALELAHCCPDLLTPALLPCVVQTSQDMTFLLQSIQSMLTCPFLSCRPARTWRLVMWRRCWPHPLRCDMGIGT